MRIKILYYVLFAFCIENMFAFEPNSVKTTIINVDGSNNNVVSTEYSDGFGRVVEQKVQLPPDQSTTPPTQKDMVTCAFYNQEGRLQYTTKSFVDCQKAGSYLPGLLTDASVSDQLKASNHNDLRAFSETEYWNEPAGRVKAQKGPGAAFQNDAAQSWIFWCR